jgi:DNA-binding response OmpR family regulator
VLHHRILVVEDDPAMRGLLAETLREDGHLVHAVSSGLAAVDELHAAVNGGDRIPDVLVSDLRMPGCSGLETVRRLRELGCEMYVFLMTAFGSEELRSEAYRLGVLEVFDKPFDISDLLAAIRQLDGAR